MSHAIIDIRPAKGERLYAVGDIHGCFEELVALEAKIASACQRANVRKYRILSVGDLCDRGPDTRGVIEHFARGKERGTHAAILGNHETFFILAFMGARSDLIEKAGIRVSWYHDVLSRVFHLLTTKMENWRRNGGASVFKSYGADIDDHKTWDQIPASHLRFLFEAPLIIRTPKAVIGHALSTRGDLELFSAQDAGQNGQDKETDEAVVRCLWERALPKVRLDLTRRHISGHTPTNGVIRDLRLGTIQIDTGAVYGRELTALDLEKFRAISVGSKFNCR